MARKGANDEAVVDFKDIVTMVAASIAALCSAINLWKTQFSGKDSVRVEFGPLTPDWVMEETMVAVISRSSHRVEVIDYGFIEPDFQFTSIPGLSSACDLQGVSTAFIGSMKMERYGDTLEAGYVRKHKPIGCYARISTRTRPFVHFSDEVRRWRRLLFAVRLWFSPNYHSW